MPLDSEIEIGVIGRPHGVHGASSLFLHNPQSPLVKQLGEVILESADGQERLILTVKKVASGRKGAKTLVSEEVQDRDAAAALTGYKVLIPKEWLPDIEDEDEFYYHELLGASVETASGQPLGTVKDVIWTSCDVLTVALTAGGELLIPVVGDYVVTLDRAPARVVVVDDAVELLTP
jgi:16S rRNA processing protein RimM